MTNDPSPTPQMLTVVEHAGYFHVEGPRETWAFVWESDPHTPISESRHVANLIAGLPMLADFVSRVASGVLAASPRASEEAKAILRAIEAQP